jgi:hypothetical protein
MNKLLEDMMPLIPDFFKVVPQAANYPYAPEIKGVVATLSVYLLSGYFLLQLISVVRRAFEGGRFNARVFTVPGLYLVVYSVVITLWNYEDQMTRFLIVVLPLFWMFFFKPFLPLIPDLEAGWSRRAVKAWTLLAVLMLSCVVALWPASNSYHVVKISRDQHWVESGKYKWMWGEYKQVFAWINRNLPPDAPLGVGSDVVFHLYTDHPTFYIFYASLRKKNGRFTSESIPLLMQSLDHYGIKYLVAEPHMQFRTILFPVNLVAKELLDTFPNRFQHIYGSPRGAINIYKILPPKK